MRVLQTLALLLGYGTTTPSYRGIDVRSRLRPSQEPAGAMNVAFWMIRRSWFSSDESIDTGTAAV